MSYSLAYRMQTGVGHRVVAMAQLAVDAHVELLLAGAGGIVIRDPGNIVITLAGVRATAEWRKLNGTT